MAKSLKGPKGARVIRDTDSKNAQGEYLSHQTEREEISQEQSEYEEILRNMAPGEEIEENEEE